MPFFSFCGRTVESNIDLPELSPTHSANSNFFFRLEANNHEQFNEIEWANHWYSETELTLSYGKQPNHHWLRFSELAYFKISLDTKKISGFPFSVNVPEETVRHLLLDQVLPRCLAYKGKLMLHASAVMLEQGLLIFTGEAGAGKSTMAANFQQAGYSVVSDDCIHLLEGKGVRAIPSYSGLRLFDDSLQMLFRSNQKSTSVSHYSTKKRLYLNKKNQATLKELPVSAIVVLSAPSRRSHSQNLDILKLDLLNGFLELFKQLFRLDVLNADLLLRDMKAVKQIVTNVPIYKLTLPHNYELLPAARKIILETMFVKS